MNDLSCSNNLLTSGHRNGIMIGDMTDEEGEEKHDGIAEAKAVEEKIKSLKKVVTELKQRVELMTKPRSGAAVHEIMQSLEEAGGEGKASSSVRRSDDDNVIRTNSFKI